MIRRSILLDPGETDQGQARRLKWLLLTDLTKQYHHEPFNVPAVESATGTIAEVYAEVKKVAGGVPNLFVRLGAKTTKLDFHVAEKNGGAYWHIALLRWTMGSSSSGLASRSSAATRPIR
jgi:hypothetical protein